MDKLRLGVIGAGSWAVSSHLPNLMARSNEVEFVGVNRREPEMLELVKERFGFERGSLEYQEILDMDLDICVIASPTSFHREHAVAAMEAGADIMLEKPISVRAWEAREILDKANELDRRVFIAFGWNYRPVVVQAADLMAEPGIGEIEHVEITMSSVTRDLLTGTGGYPDADPESVPRADTWIDPLRSGGGYAQAQLCHALGLALELGGMQASEVFAMMSNPHGGPVELHDTMSIRWNNAATGSVSGASLANGAEDNRHQLSVRLFGREGFLHLDVGRDRLTLQRVESESIEVSVDTGAGLYDCVGPIDALIDGAQGRSVVNRSSAELGVRVTEVLEAAYASAAANRPVLVSELADKPESK